jgi:hypothetical protein
MKSKRFPRKIPVNKTSYRPKYFVFFDTETTSVEVAQGKFEQRLRLYVAKLVKFSEDGEYNVTKTIKSCDKRDFILLLDFCCMQFDNVLLASHNLVFDFTILQLLEQLEENNYDLIQFYAKQLNTQFRYIRDGVNFTFFDTVSLFQSSIKNIGKIVSLDKIEIDIVNSSDNELFTYCERDVDIIIKMMSYWYKFLNENDAGDFRTTIASTAFSIYRHKFMNISIDIHCHQDVNELERLAYKGGRVELFYRGYTGYKELYKLDINSMYPYAMWKYKYPRMFSKKYVNPTIEFLKDRLTKYCCIAHCNITTTENFVPVKINNRNIYPVGTFDCYLTTEELKFALQHQKINNVYCLLTYASGYIFKDYVSYMYEKRIEAYEENNKPMYAIIKLLLNSLYGKFGQVNCEMKDFGYDERNAYNREYGYDIVSNRRYTITTINHKSFIEFYGGESAMSFPGIAAHVTANARLYLYELIRKVKTGKVYYCDTDSLIVDKVGYNELKDNIDDVMLGKLKVEAIASRAVFYAPKDYNFGGNMKRKGISKTAVRINRDTYAQQKWQRFAGLFMDNNPNLYYINQTQKHLKRIVYSGRINDDCSLSPYSLPEDFEEILSIMKQL